eukprot:gb/GFBE01018956.1/.p1 GENE.gb/GFBE01018956.1/~~gb/GFBE01018956.1/.p1  ORF type:complete len:670 (+),score=126.78 gb/GFBE01018956.1/:1-2010(+)
MTNPFTGVDFESGDGSGKNGGGGGGGGGSGGRRLASAAVDQMVLLRSEDGSSWTATAAWNSPQPGSVVSLSSSYYRPSWNNRAQGVAWDPVPDGCSICGAAGRGIQALQTLQLSFSKKVYFGDGDIKITRGGGLSTLALSAANSPWFQLIDNTLMIKPQVAMGGSASCTEVEIGARALIDADGYEFVDVLSNYATCIVDFETPELSSTDPPNQSPGVDLMPKLQLAFNEAVRISADAPPATLTARGVPAGGGLIPATQVIEIAGGSSVSVFVWNVNNGAMAVDLYPNSQLEPQTSYELRLQPGTIEDLSGNKWEGGTVIFTTKCSASGCASASTAPPSTASTQDADTEETAPQSVAVYLAVVAALTIACAFGVGIFQLYVRKSLFGSKNKVHPESDEQVNRSHADGSVHSTPTAKVHVGATPSPAGPRGAGQARWDGGSGPFFQNGAPAYGGASGQRYSAQAGFKSNEAEDIRGKSRYPSSPEGSGVHKQSSFTDDSAVGDGWVKNHDPRTGEVYWQHYKTREKRYDRPPKSHSSASTAAPPRQDKPQAPSGPKPGRSSNGSKERQDRPRASFRPNEPRSGGGASSASTPKKDKPPEPAPLSENPEVAAVLADLDAQLEKTKKEDIASRKKAFKFMCLKWHPDKNQENLDVATEVFQWLQSQRDWYLKE